MNFRDQDLLIFDGACGTSIQEMDLPEDVWDGRSGCNEILNITIPEKITVIHREFLDAGAMVVETNTFGANRIVLAEYGLENRVTEINTAAVHNARKAVESFPGTFVAGSIGPGTRLPTLGQITVDDLEAAVREQAEALVDAGVDAIIIETCQDLLQLKTTLVTALDVAESSSRDIPVLVSVTIEVQGTMLLGTDIAAVAATVEPFPVFSLGLNCATGPAGMESHLRYLHENWSGRISCMPNQGMPEVRDGKTHYPLTPDDFAVAMRGFIGKYRISIVGGCCGSTPKHIRALTGALRTLPKKDSR